MSKNRFVAQRNRRVVVKAKMAVISWVAQQSKVESEGERKRNISCNTRVEQIMETRDTCLATRPCLPVLQQRSTGNMNEQKAQDACK